MFHAREDWAAATPLAPRFASFGRRAETFDLRVDLGRDLFSSRWWRGVATLSLLCGAAAFAAPGFEPLPGGARAEVPDRERLQSQALAISPLGTGSRTGLGMAPTDAVAPLPFAPERPRMEISARLGRLDSIERLLLRTGAAYGDARAAAAMIGSAAPRLAPGTKVAVLLGARSGDGSRPVQRISMRAELGLTLTIERAGNSLRLVRQAMAVDTTPLRVRGSAGGGLYWSLRAAGVPPETAAEYLRAIGSRLDVGADIMPNDRFDLIIANRRAANGESQSGPLLYAGLDRAAGNDLQLMKWTVGGRTDWWDGNLSERRSEGMIAPVAGRITSGFGTRIHPILRFARFHSGVDFGAEWGAPIVATADGHVVGAGWSGGYGRQVRLAHGSGIVTTYSHMSRIVAEPGTIVRQGQLIGYVGSSGLSTGPHLHYEVRIGGQPVNPLSVRFERRMVQGPELDAFKARLKALLSIGEKRG